MPFSPVVQRADGDLDHSWFIGDEAAHHVRARCSSLIVLRCGPFKLHSRPPEALRTAWLPTSLPAWLTQSAYRDKILPRLANVAVTEIAKTLAASETYASRVRKGQQVPHPMHWEALANLVGGPKVLD